VEILDLKTLDENRILALLRFHDGGPSAPWQWQIRRIDLTNASNIHTRQLVFAAGRVEVAATNNRVTVQFNAAQNASAAEGIFAAQAVVSGMQKLNEVTRQLSSGVAVTGATSALVTAVEAKSATSGADMTGQQGGGGSSKEKRDQAAEALEQSFAVEIKDGLVILEGKDGAVIVKDGSGGAFPMADATLTPLAIGLIEKIGDVARQAGYSERHRSQSRAQSSNRSSTA
jgi:flagellar motor protein MotB